MYYCGISNAGLNYYLCVLLELLLCISTRFAFSGLSSSSEVINEDSVSDSYSSDCVFFSK